MKQSIMDDFLNPSNQYRGKPFWSWNGELEKEELIRQIHIMKEMGLGGFFMHSRTGLSTEYMGEEWFDCINACADEAEKLGMEAWIYDEDRWPSGIAGGMVTENPEYRMNSLKLSIIDIVDEFIWQENTLAAFSCLMEGEMLVSYQRFDKSTSPSHLVGKKILVFSKIEMSLHSFFNGFTYLDTLNKEATERFIELTHEKYRLMCGERLGKSIKGIFTDEPHRGTLMDIFGLGNDEDIFRVPWTKALPHEFLRKYGYDVFDYLPELFLKVKDKPVSQVKWHYVDLLQHLFIDNFAKPIIDWCEKNNIALTGHVLHEDSLTAQTVMCGSVMRYYEYMTYPGVDVLTEGNNKYWIVKQLASVGRQLGKKFLLSELYGCTGWQMDFESHKAVGDWQALFGINLRCHHLSWYTMEGEAKRDYPASILHQSTWWKEYQHVEDYFSRIGLVLSQGKAYCETLVMNPIESVWCHIHPGWSKMLSSQSADVNEIERHYEDLFYWLTQSHIDFDYGEEEMMSRHASIIYDQDKKPLLKIGEAAYKVVIVGGLTTIRSTSCKILKEFIEVGGTVIFAGEPPTYVDAKLSTSESEILENMKNGAVHVPWSCKELVDTVLSKTRPTLDILDGDGENIKEIFCQIREDEETYYLLLLNTHREKGFEHVKIKLPFKGNLEEWDCTTGERTNIGVIDALVNKSISTIFEAGRMRMYRISKQEDLMSLPKEALTEVERYPLLGPYLYSLDEPNVCVLDMAKFKINNEKWQDTLEILKIDRAVRNYFKLPLRGGEMLQPWFAKRKGFEVLGKLSLQFEFNIDVMPSESLELIMERPEHFNVRFNDMLLVKEELSEHWWIDRCFKRIQLPKHMMVIGNNTIELQVDFHEGINLEAIYLLGDFGVKIEGYVKTLIRLPEMLNIGSIVEQGLPFYTGKLQYFIEVQRKPMDHERLFIAFDEFEGACIKVMDMDGKFETILGWHPYETEILHNLLIHETFLVEIVLTRRNVFGPLHQIPLRPIAYAPFSFVTEGDEFSEDYMLIPSGLLKEPYVIKRTKKD